METLPITRSIDLDVDGDTVWSLISTGGGLAQWLADEVDLEVMPGATGRIGDRGQPVRTVVVSEVEAGRRLGFTWWSEDDPADASSVVITVEPSAEPGGTTLTVTETADGTADSLQGAIGCGADALTGAAVEHLMADLVWDGRLRVLADATVGVLVGA